MFSTTSGKVSVRLYVPKSLMEDLFGALGCRAEMISLRDTDVRLKISKKLEVPAGNSGLELSNAEYSQLNMSAVLGLTNTKEQSMKAVVTEAICVLRGADGTLVDAWQYVGSEDKQLHGPFTLAQLNKWQNRFPPTHLARHQQSGVWLPLHFLVDAHAMAQLQGAIQELATPRRSVSRINTAAVKQDAPSNGGESPVGMMSVGSPYSSSLQSARTLDQGSRNASQMGMGGGDAGIDWMDIDRDLGEDQQVWLQAWLASERVTGELAAVPMEGVEMSDVPAAYLPTRDSQNEANGATSSPHLLNSVTTEGPEEPHSIYVVDTNVLLSNMYTVKLLVQKLRRIMSSDVVYLPYVVLAELDRLKSRRSGDARSYNVATYAQSAIRFINSELGDAAGVVKLQSVKDAIQADKEVDLPEIAGERSNDDYILRTCLALARNLTITVILVTNDQGLQAKAKGNRIGVLFGKEMDGKRPSVVQQVMSMRRLDTWSEEEKAGGASESSAGKASGRVRRTQEAVSAVQPDFVTLAATYIVFHVSQHKLQNMRQFVQQHLGLSDQDVSNPEKGPLTVLQENMSDLRITGQLLLKLGGKVRIKATQLVEATQQTNAPKHHQRLLRIMMELSEVMLTQFESSAEAAQQQDTMDQYRKFNRQVGRILAAV